MRVWGALALALVAAGQEPSLKPVLRIELGGHVDGVDGTAIDPGGRWLVTASDDGTGRLWDVESRRLVSVLRPPTSGQFVKLTAAAISNDGERIAIGGGDWDNHIIDNHAFVFDRHGRLIRILDGIRGEIHNIALTSDNKNLVIASWGGIEVFNFNDFSHVASLRDKLSREIRSAAISPSGDILYVAMAQNKYSLVACKRSAGHFSCDWEIAAPDNYIVHPPAFSETGTESVFSTTYAFAPHPIDKPGTVQIYSFPELKLLRSLRTEGPSWGDFYYLAWTSGDCVVGAASKLIRFWDASGHGAPQDMPTGKPARVDPFGKCSAHVLLDGSFFRLDSRDGSLGRPLLSFRAPVAPVWLGVTGDWRSVAIPQEGESTAPTFNLRSRTIEGSVMVASSRTTSYIPAGREFVARQVREHNAYMDNTRDVLRLDDLNAMILSTYSTLELVASDGSAKWSVPAPNMVSWLGVSSDRTVLAGYFPDGVVRWYRFSDGKEFLALFAHPDRKRSVLWTPSGYYDASPGGEDLIGSQVSNGVDQAADFFPASRFRSTYYRPDIIDRVISTLDETDALRLADSERNRATVTKEISSTRPPVVRILAPADGQKVSQEQVTVQFEVSTPADEAVTGLRVLVDGRPIPAAQGTAMKTTDRQVLLTIPRQDCEVSVIAENRFAASEAASIHLHRGAGSTVTARGVTVLGTTGFVQRPVLYVLAVGSNYSGDNALRYPAKDAKDFVAAAFRQSGELYRDVKYKLLTGETSTKDEIVDGLDWIEKSTGQHDVAMVFLAGHGVNDTNGIYYCLPNNFDPDKLKRTAVAMSDIRETVQHIVGKVILFVDTCHAGNVLGMRTRALGDGVNAFINELASAENGAIVLAAASGKELALEDDRWGNGAFTKALVEGLDGAADLQKTGRITINMLIQYTEDRVKELTGGHQKPADEKWQAIPDFPIAVRR